MIVYCVSAAFQLAWMQLWSTCSRQLCSQLVNMFCSCWKHCALRCNGLSDCAMQMFLCTDLSDDWQVGDYRCGHYSVSAIAVWHSSCYNWCVSIAFAIYRILQHSAVLLKRVHQCLAFTPAAAKIQPFCCLIQNLISAKFRHISSFNWRDTCRTLGGAFYNGIKAVILIILLFWGHGVADRAHARSTSAWNVLLTVRMRTVITS